MQNVKSMVSIIPGYTFLDRCELIVSRLLREEKRSVFAVYHWTIILAEKSQIFMEKSWNWCI